LFNQVAVNETLLERLNKGECNEKDVEVILAHEVGHAAANSWKSSLAFSAFFAYMAVPAIASFFLSFILFNSFIVSFVFAALIMCVTLGWTIFLPWVIRKTFVSNELGADSQAVSLNLVDAKDLAESIAKLIGASRNRKIDAEYMANFTWQVLKHPFMDEILNNLGFEIKRPVKIQKINRYYEIEAHNNGVT
jgi:Zn-dependent protease with chaperone function